MVKTSYQLAFGVLAVVALLGAVLFHIYSVEPGKESCNNMYSRISKAYQRLLRPYPELRRFYLFLIFDRVAWSLWFPLLSGQLKDAGYREDMIGLFYTAQSATMSATSMVWGKLADRIGFLVIAVSEFLGALALAFIYLMKPWIFPLVGLALVGLSIAAWVPSYNRTIAVLARGESLGEAYASANAVRSIAGAAPPILGGLIYDELGSLSLYGLAVVLLVGAGIYALYFAERIEQGRGKQ
ncbi:hypothetical protein PYJP_07670 [Pyrofollis japonicus]|nr:hypothetical protein PYJP_07670 [Pyrofollis japonicus]